MHDLDVVPFSWPWTRGASDEVKRNVLAHQWRNRGRTAADDWVLSLAVFNRGEIVGEQQVSAKDFPVTRSGDTRSWLGSRHHGQGIGTRMRPMVLHLAFEGLDAAEMVSDAHDDNPASNAVSRRLGYAANLTRRVAHHNTDLARAYFWQGNHDKALQSLMVAKEAAPQQTRHHPAVREVTNLLVRSHRGSNDPLARFRAWLGPDPEL